MSGVRSQQLPQWLDDNGFIAERVTRHGVRYRCKETKKTVMLSRKHTPRGENNFRSEVKRIIRSRLLQEGPVEMSKGFKIGEVANIKQEPVRRIVPTPQPATTPPIAGPNKRGNPNLSSYADQPKNWVSSEDRETITKYILQERAKGISNDDIIAGIHSELDYIRGSQGLPPSKSCIAGCFDKARQIEKANKSTKPAPIKRAQVVQTPKPAAVTPTGKLPPFVVGILTEPSLTDSEKVKMLCSYASL